MQDFDALRARVEETARRMKETQSRRLEGNQSLVDILGQLESKFSAQQDEVEFYMGRIGPLEHANTQLAGLIEKLLGMIDGGFGDESIEPLRRASAMASTILDEALAMSDPVEPSVDETAQFEDVGAEMLATDAATGDEDLDALPEIVRQGLIDQQGEIQQDAVAQIDPPEVAATVEEEPAAAVEETLEIEAVAEIEEEIQPAAEIEIAEPPEAAPSRTETIETVEALAIALDQKNAAGEPLEADDIRALLERVEALSNGPDDDDLDIPPTLDEEQGIPDLNGAAGADKTGTEG